MRSPRAYGPYAGSCAGFTRARGGIRERESNGGNSGGAKTVTTAEATAVALIPC
jgi:hypothetical protein